MNQIKAGAEYFVEHVRDGAVIDREKVHNLCPVEGINYLLNAGVAAGAQNAAHYIGLYEGNYTPQSTDTAATFPALATESTAYDEATRAVWTHGAVASGACSNSASKAEFTINATKTIYGGFMSSSSAKGSTGGTLLSAVRFSSPKNLVTGDVLRVTAGFTMTSV